MPIQTIKDETRAILRDAERKVALAEQALQDRDPAIQVRAAGDLAVLKRHRSELEQRLAELEACKDGPMPTLAERLREEGMLLRQALENFAIHH